MQWYKILHEFLESSSVLEKILQYYRQDHMKSYRILQCPRESYKIVQDPMGWVWSLEPLTLTLTHERTPQHSLKVETVESWKILQDHTGSYPKSYKMVINFSQDTMGS